MNIILDYHGMSWDILDHCDIRGHPRTSQLTAVCPNNPTSRASSYCVPGCPGTSQDILTRGHLGISQDIPVNCCISKQSHVQGILFCPRMSWDIPGHPNKRYIYTSSWDIQGDPRTSQSTAVYPNNPMSSASYCVPGYPGHPNKTYASSVF